MSLFRFSNFVPSNDFGSPILNDNDEDVDALRHLNKLLSNMFNENVDLSSDLPIIIVGFSKGCIVLNEICRELSILTLNSEMNVELMKLVGNFKHFIWLDGGHNGTSCAWLTESSVLVNLLNLGINLYVYVTPYQISENNPKKWAVKEHRVFINLIEKYFSREINFKAKIYYLNEDNVYDSKNYELDAHFKILQLFDCELLG